MSTTTSTTIEIEKEDIKAVKFPAEDIFTTKKDKGQRRRDLERASALGAQSKSNIKIYFQDEEGKQYRTKATVWATTEQSVTLKGGILIPIKAIYKIGFF